MSENDVAWTEMKAVFCGNDVTKQFQLYLIMIYELICFAHTISVYTVFFVLKVVQLAIQVTYKEVADWNKRIWWEWQSHI